MTDDLADRSLMWSGPGRALDAHLDLFKYVDGAHRFIRANAGKPYVNWRSYPPTLMQRLGLMTSIADTKFELQLDGETVGPRREDYTQFNSEYNIERTAAMLKLEYETLNEGETHYVSHHVASTLEAAAEAMPDEPLFDTDIPAPTGLVILEHPLLLPDLHPDTGVITPELVMPLRAIGWKTHTVHVRDKDTGELSERDGIFYCLYTDSDSFRKYFVESSRRLMGDERVVRYENDYPLRMWAVDSTAWAFGTQWKTGNEAVGEDSTEMFGAGLIHENVAMTRRWLLAYFRWTWQRILTPERYTPRKHEARRAQRAGKPLMDGYIKILRLRREVEAERHAAASGEPTGYIFSHQWIVRGHPRRQWYKSLGPARNPDGSFNVYSHRLIWIEPHLSGNPYGQLVAGHNVVAAVR